MEKYKRVRIIGAGAVGLLYGSLLQSAGHEVEYQSASGWKALRENGLSLKSVWGDRRLEIDAFPSTREMSEGDLVLVCVKAVAGIDYESLLKPVVGKNTAIVLVQNGINTDEKIRAMFPSNPCCGAAAFVCVTRTGPAEVDHAAYGRLDFGWTEDTRELCEDLAGVFREAGGRSNAAGPLRLIRWKKLLWNLPFNVLSVLTGGLNTKEMMASASLMALIRSLMREVAEAAAAEGWTITETDIDQMIDNTKKMVPYKTSMLVDFENKRPMEVAAILGEPLKSAQKNGVAMPRVEVLHALLSDLDLRAKAASL